MRSPSQKNCRDRAFESSRLVVSWWCSAKYGRSDRYLAMSVS
nr:MULTISPECIES: hypothetical protein [unclassified Trichocoleus]